MQLVRVVLDHLSAPHDIVADLLPHEVFVVGQVVLELFFGFVLLLHH
jgi:hypothetical protein